MAQGFERGVEQLEEHDVARLVGLTDEIANEVVECDEAMRRAASPTVAVGVDVTAGECMISLVLTAVSGVS